MKIAEAQPIYYAKRKQLVEQIRSLADRKNEAERNYKIIGNSYFSEEAATLELSIEETDKAFKENQKVVDSLMEQWVVGCFFMQFTLFPYLIKKYV